MMNLLDLAAVCFDAPQVGSHQGAHRDVFTNEPRQHFGHVGDKIVQVQDRWRKHLLAAEGKQLPG